MKKSVSKIFVVLSFMVWAAFTTGANIDMLNVSIQKLQTILSYEGVSDEVKVDINNQLMELNSTLTIYSLGLSFMLIFGFIGIYLISKQK